MAKVFMFNLTYSSTPTIKNGRNEQISFLHDFVALDKMYKMFNSENYIWSFSLCHRIIDKLSNKSIIESYFIKIHTDILKFSTANRDQEILFILAISAHGEYIKEDEGYKVTIDSLDDSDSNFITGTYLSDWLKKISELANVVYIANTCNITRYNPMFPDDVLSLKFINNKDYYLPEEIFSNNDPTIVKCFHCPTSIDDMLTSIEDKEKDNVKRVIENLLDYTTEDNINYHIRTNFQHPILIMGAGNSYTNFITGEGGALRHTGSYFIQSIINIIGNHKFITYKELFKFLNANLLGMQTPYMAVFGKNSDVQSILNSHFFIQREIEQTK